MSRWPTRIAKGHVTNGGSIVPPEQPESEPLVGRDALFVLYPGLDVVHGIGRLEVQRNRLARQGFDKDFAYRCAIATPNARSTLFGCARPAVVIRVAPRSAAYQIICGHRIVLVQIRPVCTASCRGWCRRLDQSRCRLGGWLCRVVSIVSYLEYYSNWSRSLTTFTRVLCCRALQNDTLR